MQILPQSCHLGVDLRLVGVRVLVLPLESQGPPDSAQGPVLLVGGLVLLVLCLLPDQTVLVVIGDPNFGADDHHHVRHDLGVVHHDGLDGTVQHPDFEQPHLLSVLERVLGRGEVTIIQFLSLGTNISPGDGGLDQSSEGTTSITTHYCEIHDNGLACQT